MQPLLEIPAKLARSSLSKTARKPLMVTSSLLHLVTPRLVSRLSRNQVIWMLRHHRHRMSLLMSCILMPVVLSHAVFGGYVVYTLTQPFVVADRSNDSWLCLQCQPGRPFHSSGALTYHMSVTHQAAVTTSGMVLLSTRSSWMHTVHS